MIFPCSHGFIQKALGDDFRIGISLEKSKMRVYRRFQESDIIVASPFGLKLVVESENPSFLSSIDILYLDRAHVFLLQNFQHLYSLLPLLNILPEHKFVTSDFNNISPYYFENLSKFYRQTVLYTEHSSPELINLFENHTNNFQGAVRSVISYEGYKWRNLKQEIANRERLTSFKGKAGKKIEEEESTGLEDIVDKHGKQISFVKIDLENPENYKEQKFNYFKNSVWAAYRENEALEKSLIFVSDYLEFLRLKDHFKKINSPVGCVCEYTKRAKIQSTMAKYNGGTFKYLLITERAFYFDMYSSHLKQSQKNFNETN